MKELRRKISKKLGLLRRINFCLPLSARLSPYYLTSLSACFCERCVSQTGKPLAAAEQSIVQFLRTSQLATSLSTLFRHVLVAIFTIIILGPGRIFVILPLSGDGGIGPLLIFVQTCGTNFLERRSRSGLFEASSFKS